MTATQGSTRTEATPAGDLVARAVAWLVPAAPRSRLAVLRVIAYAFALFDMFWLNAALPLQHARLPAEFYRPLHVGRLLHLPTPSPELVQACRWGALVFAVIVLAGRIPRLGGLVVACCYFEWAVVFNSYGKVNHDRLGFVLLLFAIPTAGRLSLRDDTPDERVGWALLMAQLGAVATYFLAAIDKIRFTGWSWVNGGEFERSIARRGTSIGDAIARVPNLLHVSQYLMLAAEFLAFLLWHPRWGRKLVVVAFVFHAMTFAAITIGFWPHQISLLAFLPLEVVAVWWRQRSSGPAPTDPEPSPA